MIGQGRPQRSSRAARTRRRRVERWLVAAVLALAAMTTANGVAAEVALKLRISWGGGAERAWRGEIAATQGVFSDLVLLGIEADSTRAVWLENSSTLQVAQPSARVYDGADVWFRGDSDSEVTIQLQAAGSPAPVQLNVPLAEIIGTGHTSTLDDTGNRVSIVRAPGDRLRVTFERPHLVFAPGEPFDFKVEPYEVGESVDGMQLQTLITSSPSEQKVWSNDYPLTAGVTAVKVLAPESEGVYNLRLTIAPPSRIKQRLRLAQPVVERNVQIVVLAPQSPASGGDPPTSKIVEINPVNPRWWDRLTSLPAIPGFRKGPLGNGDAAPWEHPTLGPFIQLGPGGAAPDASWEAYPLPIHQPGAAHVLEVEYPSDVPQTMGISLLEPNAAGEVAPIGLDSGLYVADEDAASAPRIQRHRIVFWPKTKAPLVLFTNRRAGSRAVYGKITVYSAAANQLAMLAMGRGPQNGLLPPAFDKAARPERLWAGYMDRPLVPENFGAAEFYDATTQRSLDDWSTFYQAGTRLVSYLQHAGYNGLMLSALADGSTIYPTQIAGPTPRYDTGVFFSSGQDAQRKDALELFFRLFDREGLALIPAIQFAAPLPELETLRRASGSEDGLVWIGPDGKPLDERTARQGLAPYYNLLDPRVQEAMARVVRELTQRYAGHAAFRGVALQISPEGYAELPGDQYGLDDATIARFEQAAHLKVPGEGPQRFAARERYVTGPGHAAWLEWRSRTVSEFYRRLEREIEFARPGAKLYLAGCGVLDGPEMQRQLRPSLLRRPVLADTLKSAGLDIASYSATGGVVALRPHVVRPALGGPRWVSDSETYEARELDELFLACNQRGAVFYHEPQKLRLASFDAKSPFGPSNTYVWLASQISPAGEQNRRRFVQALAASDLNQIFDGGWTLPLGQEAALRPLLSVYRQLPEGKFETVPGEYQPLTIRTRSQADGTYLYLVNDSPWPATATLTLGASGDCQLTVLGESDAAGNLQRGPGQLVWRVPVGAYDLVAVRLSQSEVPILAASVELPEGVRESLENEIQDLVARVRASGQSLIHNAGFDQPADGEQLPGWTASRSAGTRVLLDARNLHGGSQSLLLASQGAPVSITSDALTPPPSGRVMIEVWLRTLIDASTKPPALRIAIEGTSAAGPFRSQGIIQAVGVTAHRSGDWVPYSFPVENLPQEALTGAVVKFELLGAGQVWLDDVQVRSFSSTELGELAKINSMARLHLDKGRYASCARLLDGYWPRFLVSNVPLTSSSTPVARRPKPPEPEPTEPVKSPSLFETMKSYLPPMFR